MEPHKIAVIDTAVSQDIATVRVKDQTCGTVDIKLAFHDTIGYVTDHILITSSTLRDHMTKYRASRGVHGDFAIKTLYPAKTHDDDAKTLQECGLVPNCVVVVTARL